VSRGYDAYDPDKDREKDAPESKRYASFALANQNEHDHRQPAKHAQAVDENPIILQGVFRTEMRTKEANAKIKPTTASWNAVAGSLSLLVC